MVFDALEYQGDQGLVTVDTPYIGDGRAYIWQEVREKFAMDAAYFHGNVPVVYFKELQTIDDEYLRRLHRSLWNHNRAPLLIAVLPQEVRVYNCFAPPQRSADQSMLGNATPFKQAIRQVTDVLSLRRELSGYGRREIVAGRFVRAEQGGFNREYRVDKRLLENLGRCGGV